MDLNQLETFISVADNQSFTKASIELFITQSSVSKIIKSLEEEVGGPLFYRSPDIRLTDVGMELYKHSVDVIALMDRIPDELENLTELKKGSIRIGIPPLICSNFFPAIIGRFKEKYPGIKITLVELELKSIEEEINAGNLDIAIVCSAPYSDESFEVHKILGSQLQVGIHKSHPLVDSYEISLEDLAKESFVLFNKEFSIYDTIINSCYQYGFEPDVVCNSSQKDFIVEMVASKMGITLLPEISTKRIRHPDIKFIPLIEPEININLMLLWKKNRYLPYACREWIKFTANELSIEVVV